MLAREFLRLCALEALRPSGLLGANGPWPTSAGTYVFDTRIDPIDDLSVDEKRPTISVYTENEDLEKIAQAGPLFYKSTVDLVFEVGVVAQFAVDGSQELIVDYADTDAALEALIGAIDDQIFWCLHYGPSGALFRKMAKLPFLSWESSPKRSGEEAYRLAKRTIVAKVPVKEVCYQGVPDTTPANLMRLPPALRDIASQLSADSTYLGALVLGMARTASVMPIRVNLEGVSMNARLGENEENMVDVSAEIKSALEITQTVASGGAIVIDYSKGTMQSLILAADVNGLSVVNWPAPGKTGRLILNITNTGAFGINAWPHGTAWSAGVLPAITQGTGKRDIVVLTTQDAGATIFGNVVGQDYQ